MKPSPEKQQDSSENFDLLGDSQELSAEYWSDKNRIVGVTDAACGVTLPAGILVYGYCEGIYQYRRGHQPIQVRVPTRDSTNYDNQRRILLDNGDTFFVVAAGRPIPEDSDMNHDPVIEAQTNVAEQTNLLTKDQ